MIRSRGRKKSLFPGISSIPSDTTLDFVSDGVNYKITLADYLASLGVTGTIAQEGDPTATPVLDIQGSANLIRNLETDDSSGIAAAVSALNGVYLALDAQTTGSGVPVLNNENHIRRILAGAGISVAASGDDIVVGASATPGTSSVVNVGSLSDFPTPASGLITLLADTIYFMTAIVDVGSNAFVMGSDTVVTGLSSGVVGITSATTDPLFSNSAGYQNEVSGIQITCPNAVVFEITNGAGTADLLVQRVDIVSCVSIWQVTAAFLVRFERSGVDLCSGDAFQFFGANGLAIIDTVGALGWTGTLFNLGTATFDSFDADTIIAVSSTGTNLVLDGAASSGNINSGGQGDIREVRVAGTTTASTTILSDDIRWAFSDNSFIADSAIDGLLYMQGNATETAIAVAGTPVLVAGTWVVEQDSKMTGTAAGRLTYDAARPVTLDVTASLTVSPASGTNQALSVQVAVNGVPVAGSARAATVNSTSSSSITVPWLIELESGDYVEMFVANATTTNNVLVSSAVLRVS